MPLPHHRYEWWCQGRRTVGLSRCTHIYRDRITTRSPGNGGGGHRRYNARLGQSPMPDPGVTPVQRQGYPSERSGVGRQMGPVRADFVRFGGSQIIEGSVYQCNDANLHRCDFQASVISGVGHSGRRSFRASIVPGVDRSRRRSFQASVVPGVGRSRRWSFQALVVPGVGRSRRWSFQALVVPGVGRSRR